MLRPEVRQDDRGQPLVPTNRELVEHLLGFDAVLVAGEAKSHCVAWTVEDLLAEIRVRDPALARKVVLLDDCTSPVVVPGVVDFTDAADAAYARFAAAGMRRVKSTDDRRARRLIRVSRAIAVGDRVEQDAGAVRADAVEVEARERAQLLGVVDDPGGDLEPRLACALATARRRAWPFSGITTSQPPRARPASSSSVLAR